MHILSDLRQACDPKRLLPGLTAGLVTGIMAVIIQISLAALVFSGDLAGYVSRGIGFTLFGAFVVALLMALTSSFPGTVAVPQGGPAAILAVIVAAVVASMPALASAECTLATAVAAMAVSTVFTGLCFLVLGCFRLGDLVRYVPYPVIGGFLAGTGWLLASGGVRVITGVTPDLAHAAYLLQTNVLVMWLPGLGFAVVLLLVLRRWARFWITPAMLLGAVGVFYLLLRFLGIPISQAYARGWLLGPFPEGGLWQPLTAASWGQVDWRVIVSQAGSIGTVAIISVISVLLRASGLELTGKQDIDLNRELRAAGVANLLGGIGGSPVSYHSMSLSTLGHRLGANSRLVGLTSALLCGVVLLFGGSLISFFPNPVLGGLLVLLGLSFLVDWVYDAWFRLPRADYVIVLLILITINALGLLPGVGLGVGLAVILFVVNYSRTNAIKHTLSGASFRSNVDRPRLYQQLLREKGHWIYILQLQGYVFFGTANSLLQQVRRRLVAPRLPAPRFVVFDFRQVSGLDASAALAFVKMKQLAQAQHIVLVLTHLSPAIRRQLELEVLTGEDADVWRVFPDLDHGVEWCEERVIEALQSVGLTARPRSAGRQLAESLPVSGRLGKLKDLLGSDDSPRPAEPEPLSAVMEVMERQEVKAGHYLVRQGDAAEALYYVAEGQVTLQVAYEDGRSVRLRTMGAGTTVGEEGLYLRASAPASVVATQPSVIYRLSAERLAQLEREAPQVAAAFHRFIAELLSERLVSATDTLQALLE